MSRCVLCGVFLWDTRQGVLGFVTLLLPMTLAIHEPFLVSSASGDAAAEASRGGMSLVEASDESPCSPACTRGLAMAPQRCVSGRLHWPVSHGTDHIL